MRAEKRDGIVRHEMLGGELVEFAPSVEEEAFLRRLEGIVRDGTLHAEALETLLWSEENPLLDTSLVPGRAFATKETLDNPAWRVMRDLLDRRRTADGTLDWEAAQARYTVTVREAAGELGIHESAVRQAIQAGRLAAVKRGGQHFLDSASVKRYHVSNRGPTRKGAELHVREGHKTGVGFRTKRQPPRALIHMVVHGEPGGAATVADIQEGWHRIAVLTNLKQKGGPDDQRLFILAPAAEWSNLDCKGFYVRGQFEIAEKINNSREALDAWKDFQPI